MEKDMLSTAVSEPVILRNGSQPSIKGPDAWFTGTVRIDPLFPAHTPARASSAYVTFEPGARTAWHTHPLGQALVISANDPSLYRSFIHGIRYPQQGILRDNEKRVYFRVLRELVDGCKQEGSVHAGRDREELVADLVALHRGMLLEWRIYEGTFDLPRRGRRMAAALLEGWRHEEE